MPFWLACEVVDLLFQQTEGRYFNLYPLLNTYLNLFFNSLQTKDQNVQEPMAERKRKRGVLIWET